MRGTNSAKRLRYLVPPSVFQFRKLEEFKFSVFIRIQSILHDSVEQNLLKLKRESSFLRWKTNLKNKWNIWSPILYVTFKNVTNPNSWSFISFQCILYQSLARFVSFWMFRQIKKGRLNFLGEINSAKTTELLGHSFLISGLKIRRPKFFVFIRF